MAVLLELRENIKRFYGKFDAVIVPVVRFLAALIVLSRINSRMGYMTRIDSTAVVLIVALMCSFLPSGAILFFGALFTMLHIYTLSLEVSIVALVVYLLVYLLYLRFAPSEGFVVVATALLLSLRIPYVVPIVMGLVGSPASAVSVACGIIAYYLLSTVTGNATNINAMSDDEAIAKLKLVVDALLGNKAMLVLIVAFTITTIVVYVLRRLSIEHAWTIAMLSGVFLDAMILLVGDLVYEVGFSVGEIFLGSFLAILVGKVLEFFRFCVDYSRTERVQFEDDEYYYYVKAVPKIFLAQSTKKVKKINQTRRGTMVTGSTDGYENSEDDYGFDSYSEGYEEGYSEDYSGDENTEDGNYEGNGNPDDYEELF
jgi:hypothetical protein